MKKIVLLLVFLFSANAFVSAETVYPKPAVVTFYQKECEECEQLYAVREEMAEKYGEKADFVSIDISADDCEYNTLVKRYNIKSVPATLFLNSQYGITKKNTGYLPKKLYEKQIEAIIFE